VCLCTRHYVWTHTQAPLIFVYVHQYTIAFQLFRGAKKNRWLLNMFDDSADSNKDSIRQVVTALPIAG
jgi:hypothetical protein